MAEDMETTATPMAEETATQMPETTATPMAEETATPMTETTATPMAEETATPMAEEPLAPDNRLVRTTWMSGEDRAFAGAEQKDGWNLKPNGRWYSFGNEWGEWVDANMEGRNDGKKPVEFRLAPGSLHPLTKDGRGPPRIPSIDRKKVLLLATPHDIEVFSTIFVKPSPMSEFAMAGPMDMVTIDWKRVATRFAGIEFNPYAREMRYKYVWYITVDLRSGCIWDPAAIAE
jgi:hypothetical protein